MLQHTHVLSNPWIAPDSTAHVTAMFLLQFVSYEESALSFIAIVLQWLRPVSGMAWVCHNTFFAFFPFFLFLLPKCKIATSLQLYFFSFRVYIF